ncbi:hypothetical protein [Curtobacterium sp. MCLR17_042]|uniref:hypothetical protein n=1 Tax=Curtobacterium sp. MCLR17_042 TaxID=2175626 RepID=UPI000DAA5CAF|nr:hypothetical protein [Curtobacterium sp. MCLR17_042]PZE28436.1 hypothetical protein DEJ02_08235 [Curtobacterium sp. MCLR17_042]
MNRSPRRRSTIALQIACSTLIAGALAVSGTIAALPATAAPGDGSTAATGTTTITTPGTPVAQGDDWTVTPTDGGYTVVLTLADPLPLRAAAPVLLVDGTDIGVAQTSLDQRQLTVTTTDPAVADARSVELGWTGETDLQGNRQAATAPQTVAPSEAPAPLTDDPAAAGQYAVTRADYDLGNEAETIKGFGRKGEMRAAVFVPKDAPGKRPVVVFLHGRHEACYGGTYNPKAWPCGKGQTDIPSYLGYNAAATALASHGNVVVSISANAINALDGSYSDDGGAVARGQLVLDHLSLLQRADAGQEPRLSPLLTGKLDLQDVGLMGHSRGGDGVVRAALLNTQRTNPFGIRAVLPLAPTDFGRMTLPDTNTAVVLPYCDGDVSDLQGQHFYDDSRTAFGDDVLRSSVLVMGANHNFFNTTWTPGKYAKASSDDWYDESDAVCGAKAKHTTRLSSDQQYAVGTSLISGFFRLTLDREQQFLPMFDGTNRQPAALGTADIRVSASQPGASRRDLALFDTANPAITTTGALTAKTCASTDNLPAKQILPACVSISSNAPDYTPAYLASSVPATPALHVSPTKAATGGQVHVPVAPAAGDFTGFQALSLRLTPDDTATTNANVSITLHDATGAVATRRLSDTSRAGQLLPGTRTAPRKTILQQARIPLDAFTGIDLTSVREVTIDVPQKNSGVLLSDLSVVPAATLGTPVVTKRPAARIADRFVDEGRTRTVVRAAVVLSRPAEQATTVSFDLDQAYDGRIRPAVQPVTFQPGEVCRTVAVSVNGDRTPSFSRTSDYAMTLSNTQGGSVIGDSVGTMRIREDDGVRSVNGRPTASAPAVGTPGDACAEAQASSTAIAVTPTSSRKGAKVAISATGFRAGESVTVSIDGGRATRTTANAAGKVRLKITKTVAALAPGTHVVHARGYGSDQRARGTFTTTK